MPVKVQVPGNKHTELTVIEHVLKFGADGWAEADHLTKEELAKCRRFGFTVVEEVKKAAKAVAKIVDPEPEGPDKSGEAKEAEPVTAPATEEAPEESGEPEATTPEGGNPPAEAAPVAPAAPAVKKGGRPKKAAS